MWGEEAVPDVSENQVTVETEELKLKPVARETESGAENKDWGMGSGVWSTTQDVPPRNLLACWGLPESRWQGMP